MLIPFAGNLRTLRAYPWFLISFRKETQTLWRRTFCDNFDATFSYQDLIEENLTRTFWIGTCKTILHDPSEGSSKKSFQIFPNKLLKTSHFMVIQTPPTQANSRPSCLCHLSPQSESPQKFPTWTSTKSWSTPSYTRTLKNASWHLCTIEVTRRLPERHQNEHRATTKAIQQTSSPCSFFATFLPRLCGQSIASSSFAPGFPGPGPGQQRQLSSFLWATPNRTLRWARRL